MRKGEINALKWSDIDGDIIHVRRSIAQKVKGPDIETPPKNKSSYRDLQMPKHVASSSSVNVNHCVHRAQNGNKYRRLRFSYYSVIARLRKTAGIVQDTTAAVDVKRILIRDLLTIRKQCQELILINCWKPEPTSVT